MMLYVHIPFCVHKCHYCDFNSHERSSHPWTAYQQALLNEMATWCEREALAGRTLTSIFFGGGTPSLAPPELFAAVIEAAQTHFACIPDIEITMEANPGTRDAARFAGYRAAGVNRLSIGVQSFDDQELAWLERIHDAAAARDAYAIAREAGFDNINLDLIYGLPSQSVGQWQRTLEQAISLGPEHLSCYQLTVEAHTKLAQQHAANPIDLPEDDAALALLFDNRKRLAEAGFEAYEISNYARPGRYCRHNDGYWRYLDYLGIGAGAAGKFDRTDGGVMRYSNIRRPESWIDAATKTGIGMGQDEQLSLEQAAAEAAWLALRRREGINRDAFRLRFGLDPMQHFETQLAPWRHQLEIDEAGIRLNDAGIALADTIAASLL